MPDTKLLQWPVNCPLIYFSCFNTRTKNVWHLRHIQYLIPAVRVLVIIISLGLNLEDVSSTWICSLDIIPRPRPRFLPDRLNGLHASLQSCWWHPPAYHMKNRHRFLHILLSIGPLQEIFALELLWLLFTFINWNFAWRILCVDSIKEVTENEYASMSS